MKKFYALEAFGRFFSREGLQSSWTTDISRAVHFNSPSEAERYLGARFHHDAKAKIRVTPISENPTKGEHSRSLSSEAVRDAIQHHREGKKLSDKLLSLKATGYRSAYEKAYDKISQAEIKSSIKRMQKRAKKNPTSQVISFLFDKKTWRLTDAKKWAKSHNVHPKKWTSGPKVIHAHLISQRPFRKIRNKRAGKGIMLMIGVK